MEDKTVLLCPVCWNEVCDHTEDKVEIDEGFKEIIPLLNRKGFETTFCCAGHIIEEEIYQGVMPSLYISFYSIPIDPFTFDPKVIGEGFKWTYTNKTLRYSIDWAVKFKKYNGKSKSLLKKYNHELTDHDKILMFDELDRKRKEILNWIKEY